MEGKESSVTECAMSYLSHELHIKAKNASEPPLPPILSPLGPRGAVLPSNSCPKLTLFTLISDTGQIRTAKIRQLSGSLGRDSKDYLLANTLVCFACQWSKEEVISWK